MGLCFSKEDVEKCKQKDLLEQTMSEMIGEFPALHQTIVAERDIYLTHTLRQATRCVEAPTNAQSNYDLFTTPIVLICRYLSPNCVSSFALLVDRITHYKSDCSLRTVCSNL